MYLYIILYATELLKRTWVMLFTYYNLLFIQNFTIHFQNSWFLSIIILIRDPLLVSSLKHYGQYCNGKFTSIFLFLINFTFWGENECFTGSLVCCHYYLTIYSLIQPNPVKHCKCILHLRQTIICYIKLFRKK